MPFAAKNMFYDERWIEKQENAFTCWVNYVLTPDDFKVNTEVAKGKGLLRTGYHFLQAILVLLAKQFAHRTACSIVSPSCEINTSIKAYFFQN